MLQTLLTISSEPEGALEILRVDDLSPLTEIAAQFSHVLDIFSFAWTNASTIEDEKENVRENMDKIIPGLLNVFKGTDAVTFLAFMGIALSKTAPEVSIETP